MNEYQFDRKSFLKNLLNDERLFYQEVNLCELASQPLFERLTDVNQLETYKYWQIVRSFLRAIFVPLGQVVIARFFQFIGKVRLKSQVDTYFFSFANSHTEIVTPVIKELMDQKDDSFQFLRATIGFPTIISELERYTKATNDQPGLLELYYDVPAFIQYFVCVFSMVPKTLEYIRQNGVFLNENKDIKNALPEFLVYYAPLSFLIMYVSQKRMRNCKTFVFGYDNCPRGRAFVSMASRNNIKTLSIQHGIIAKPVDYIPFADKMVVWNSIEFDKLVAIGADPTKLLIWGSPLFNRKNDNNYIPDTWRNQIVLALYNGITEIQLQQDVNLILEGLRTHDQLQLIVRPHPLDRKRIRKILSPYARENHLVINDSGSFEDVIQHCCLGMVYYSSVVFNFLLSNIPVVSLLHRDQDDPTKLIDGKVVMSIRSSNDLSAVLDKIIRMDNSFFRDFKLNKKKYLDKFLPDQKISVGENILAFIREPKANDH